MPKKSLGQNFLIDHNIAKKISNIISTYTNYNVIEVGPGNGFLTDYIIKKNPKKIILIEKDLKLYLKIKEKYKDNKKISIYNTDALTTKIYDTISKPKIIISNLPYNISIKLITNWLPKLKDYEGYYLMIQKEVAERFKYIKKVNRLNLLAYLYSDYKKEFDFSQNVFFPKPKVKSSVVSFKPNSKYNIDCNEFKNFTRVIFSTKRKKISNNLLRNNKYKKILTNNKIPNIDLSKRSEDLKFQEIINIFLYLN